jgi:hypothetical protein
LLCRLLCLCERDAEGQNDGYYNKTR